MANKVLAKDFVENPLWSEFQSTKSLLSVSIYESLAYSLISASVRCLLSLRSHVADSECQKSVMAASLLRVGANKDGKSSFKILLLALRMGTTADLKGDVAVNSTFKAIEDPLMIRWLRSWVVGQSELNHS